jgi:hypothetical protein
MNGFKIRRRLICSGIGSLLLLPALTKVSVATVYDFQYADGQEYTGGNILGQNPTFFPGGVRSIVEFNNLYSTSNNSLIHDEFEVGAGDRASFRTQNGQYFSWENNGPAISTWVNARDGFKFPAGSALGGNYAGAQAGETIKFRAYTFPIGSGLYPEMDNLPFVAETSAVVGTNGELVSFRFDSLPADARSFAAFRTTAEGDYINSPFGINTSKLELSTVSDVSPPPFPHSSTQFDFADVGVSYPLGAFATGESGQEALDKVNAAHSSSHGLHDEEFVIGHPIVDPPLSFGIGGTSTAGYPDRYLTLKGSESSVNFWVNAKEGFMFPQDGAIGVGQYNPNFNSVQNGGNPVEVIIRAYAEPIETGSFTELAGLTLVGEAKGFGTATFNTPPVLELMANARSFTVHTGDGSGNFKSFYSDVTASYAWTTLNQIIVDTVPDTEVGLAGDYNADGVVNAGDYTIWRDTLNSTTDLRADGDDSGTVDSGDYTIWKNNFGSVAGAGSGSLAVFGTVPEPGTASLIAMAALVSTLSLRHRNAHLSVKSLRKI